MYVLAVAQTVTVWKVNWQWVPSATGIVAVCFLCYLAGRLHQYGRSVDDRERSYTDGYNTATKALFSLATRATVVAGAVEAPPLLERRRIAPKSFKQGRHSVDTGDLSTLQETHRFNTWEQREAA